MGSPVPSFDSQWDPFEDGSQQHTQADNLALCRLTGWDLQYTIEWKVTVNIVEVEIGVSPNTQ
jgi:hypothetical protein